jgi:hypothetical protein
MTSPAVAPLLDRMPNLRFRTLGGRHFWADIAITPSHRIQRNVWTGHCRLLDGSDRRLVAGSLERCRAAARLLAEGHTAGGTLIVMLHGLYRSGHCFGPLQRRLRDAGRPVIAPNYPSGHASLPELGRWLNDLMTGLDGYSSVIFVTYSLGGLVLRAALAADDGWRERMPVAGIVQIGPPNRGARAATLLRSLTAGTGIAGPAAGALCEPIDLPEPPRGIPVLVVAGGTGGRVGFNPFLEGDDDGLVRVAETRLNRPHHFRRVKTLHGLLIGHPEVQRLVLASIAAWAASGQPSAVGPFPGRSFPGRSFLAGGHSTMSRSSTPCP